MAASVLGLFVGAGVFDWPIIEPSFLAVSDSRNVTLSGDCARLNVESILVL